MEKTPIQVNEYTLMLLKKLKDELNARSYDDAINKLAVQRIKKKSMAGSLAKYYKNYSMEKMVRELQEERRKSDRF
mgnify:FL=1